MLNSSPVKDHCYINEIFRSVQGESSRMGLPSTFVRLSGCPLRCSWCDTPYAFGRGERKGIDQILSEVEALGCSFVCVTGGEPLAQKGAFALIKQLCDNNYQVSLETGGSLSIAAVDPRAVIILDIKCPGSGEVASNFWENLDLLRPHDQIKFVLADREDYLWASEVCARYSLKERTEELLFSPVHGKLDPKELTHWILEDKLPVRLNLQLHKYIWEPTTRGV